jgi:hypothetical protein
MTSQLVTRIDGPAVERQLAADLARRGVIVAPVLLIVAALGWGLHGVLSAGYALVLVLINFALSAALLAWAARTSLGLLMGVALFGYVARLALITVAVLAISGQTWFSPIPLCAALLVTHLGLLVWETRYVSATLAFPGLKPRPSQGPAAKPTAQKGS